MPVLKKRVRRPLGLPVRQRRTHVREDPAPLQERPRLGLAPRLHLSARQSHLNPIVFFTPNQQCRPSLVVTTAMCPHSSSKLPGSQNPPCPHLTASLALSHSLPIPIPITTVQEIIPQAQVSQWRLLDVPQSNSAPKHYFERVIQALEKISTDLAVRPTQTYADELGQVPSTFHKKFLDTGDSGPRALNLHKLTAFTTFCHGFFLHQR